MPCTHQMCHPCMESHGKGRQVGISFKDREL
ncbi:hypothetical protein LC085_07380 [Bacillus tianshenii]|nr:hypothetical protein [Bacillus tianshenii]